MQMGSLLLSATMALTSSLSLVSGFAQQTGAVQTSINDPIREETLRTYFDEIHFVSWNRKMWELQFQKQKQQLPPWYPVSVWKETTDTIEAMDIVPIALPVYQKYISETTGRHMIKLFATKQGQATAAKMFAEQGRLQAAGENADDAYTETLAAARANEDATVAKMFAALTPADQKELAVFVKSTEWMRADADGPAISKEMSVALLERQKEIVHEVAIKHHDELVAAKRAYDAEHGTHP